MKVLVTGAGGFVGHHLISALSAYDKYEVFASTYSKASELGQFLASNQIMSGDLTNFEYVKKLLLTYQPDVIYHLAALAVVHTNVDSARQALENNLALQYNLLEAVRQYRPTTKIVVISSGNIYGKVDKQDLPLSETSPIRPLNPYATSKLSQENLALQYYYAHNLDIVILRPFNHTGAGQTDKFVIPAFAKQFAKIQTHRQLPTIKVGNLETARDFTDVRDMVQAYILASQHCESGEIYNIGSGKASTIRQILELMQVITQVKVKLQSDPSRIRGVDVPILIADSSKFRGITGWKPQISFKQTLTTVLNYWKEKI